MNPADLLIGAGIGAVAATVVASLRLAFVRLSRRRQRSRSMTASAQDGARQEVSS